MMTSTYEWLPERHLGVVATLAHADQLIEQVGNLLFEYLRQESDVVSLREVPRGDVNQTVVERIAPIPRKVALLVADALVALRAAIEHTLFAEIEYLNGAPLDDSAAKLVEMPASRSYDDFTLWVKSRARNGPDSLRHGSEILRRVSGLQPFHRHDRPDLHPLARLVSHTNHAKHRNPAITAIRIVAIVRDDEPLRSVKDFPLRDEAPIQIGDIIAESPRGELTPAALFPTIGINRPGTDEWPILMHELGEIAYWVRTQAIPRLITGYEPPEVALPARYEINVGHLDEKRAISLGETLSAAEVNKMKLGAASARGGLVEVLLPTLGTSHYEGLTAWVNQLTDAEVLERVSRLKASFQREPGADARNRSAVDDLCEEFLQFVEAQS